MKLCQASLLCLLLLPGSVRGGPLPDDVSRLADQVRAACAGLKTATFAGSVCMDYDIEGGVKCETNRFVSSFAAPGRYRHAFDNVIFVGSTGTNLYRFEADSQRYLLFPLPASRGSPTNLPYQVADVLQGQNPALLYAIATNAIMETLGSATNVHKGEIASVGGHRCDTLKFTLEYTTFTWFLDADTHLLRRVQSDFGADVKAKNRWVREVKRALLTIDYTDPRVNPKLDESQFRWEPPKGALKIPTAADVDEPAALGTSKR